MTNSSSSLSTGAAAAAAAFPRSLPVTGLMLEVSIKSLIRGLGFHRKYPLSAPLISVQEALRPLRWCYHRTSSSVPWADLVCSQSKLLTGESLRSTTHAQFGDANNELSALYKQLITNNNDSYIFTYIFLYFNLYHFYSPYYSYKFFSPLFYSIFSFVSSTFKCICHLVSAK